MIIVGVEGRKLGKEGRKEGRKYLNEQTGSKSYSVVAILNSSQPLECQLTGTESH